ncbi:hypothetical protein [Bradyrhizobium ivorense]|uniref:hypothetical protein n=1 Tax=Bradyrhizobium ivorense TaxID=2511166 RepID=UPI00155ACCDC|nr:hypothetical protein [Bradyrhizobium ivorense]
MNDKPTLDELVDAQAHYGLPSAALVEKVGTSFGPWRPSPPSIRAISGSFSGAARP